MFTSASVCVFSLHSINAFMQSIPLQSICCVFLFHDCNRHDKAQLQNYEASMFLLRYTFSSSAFGGAPNVVRCLGACFGDLHGDRHSTSQTAIQLLRIIHCQTAKHPCFCSRYTFCSRAFGAEPNALYAAWGHPSGAGYLTTHTIAQLLRIIRFTYC